MRTFFTGIMLICCFLGQQSGSIQAATLTILGDHLNVRSGPGRTYAVVESVKKDEQFQILRKQDGWYQISVEGTPGWVSGKAVALSADSSIQELLVQGDRYFERRQFTTPADANAYDLYRAVLDRDPENAHARDKIAQMARIYVSWAQRASQNGDPKKAILYYQRYLFLMPDDQSVRRTLRTLEHTTTHADPEPIPGLRTDPVTLSHQQIEPMIRRYSFHHPADWSKYGLSSSITGNFRHDFDQRSVSGIPVILDYATGLMWQESASKQGMSWSEAYDYVSRLNASQAAGFSDWRVPTLEELASLLEPERTRSRLYLAPEFGDSALWCWSADRAPAQNTAWYVSFSSGGIQELSLDHAAFIFAVRTYQ